MEEKATRQGPVGVSLEDTICSGLQATDERLCVLVVIGVIGRREKHFLAIEEDIRKLVQSWKDELLESGGRILPPDETPALLGSQNRQCTQPPSGQNKGKMLLHMIWMAETRQQVEKAFDAFLKTYEAKYPKATTCIEKNRKELLAFYEFSADHWAHIRRFNQIESAFATIRHQTARRRWCVTKESILTMIFKLDLCNEKKCRKIRRFNHLATILGDRTFKDRILVESDQNKDAA